MAVTEVTWSDLLAHPAVTESVQLRSGAGILAFHGGLEGGTFEIASAAAARAGASFYGVDQPPDLRWHVPSAEVDPDRSPPLADFLAHVEVVVAVHGYGRLARPVDVLVGGVNRAQAGRLAVHLRLALPGFTVLDDLEAIPVGLRGLHPDNPVNRVAGGGVQVELPIRARRRRQVTVAGALAAFLGDASRASDPPGF